jgi:hypothetical protein
MFLLRSKQGALRRQLAGEGTHAPRLLLLLLPLAIAISMTFVGCSQTDASYSPVEVQRALQSVSDQVPKKIDAATKLVKVISDGTGGAIFEEIVDTSMVQFPSHDRLMHMLCDVEPGSPPPTTRNPFTSVTYVYRDTNGNELATVHLTPGECPGQRL